MRCWRGLAWIGLALSLLAPSSTARVVRADIRWLGGNGSWFDSQWEQPGGMPGPFFGVNQNVKIENGAVVTLAGDAGAIASLAIGGDATSGGAVNQTGGALRVAVELAIGAQPGGASQFFLAGGLLDVGAGSIRSGGQDQGAFHFTGGTLRVQEFDPDGFGARLGGLKQNGDNSLLDASSNNTTIHGPYQLLAGRATVGAGFQVVVSGPMSVDFASLDGAGAFSAMNGLSIATAFEKNGAGTLALGGPQTPLPGAALKLLGGATTFHSDAGQNGPNLSAKVLNPGTTAAFNSSQHFDQLDVQNGATATLAASHQQPPYAPGGRYLFTHMLRVQALANSSLDLTDGALIVNYGLGANRTAPMAKLLNHGINLEGLEGSGRIWDGNGLRSSTARDDPNGITALGVIDNANIGYTTIGPDNQFGYGAPGVDGDPVPLLSTLVKYTYVGDADLNGRVDGDDLVAFLVGYANQLSLWENGDFDYSGQIDGDDLTGLLVSYLNQGAALGSIDGRPRPVPEPGMALYAAVGAVGLAAARYSMVRRAASSPLRTHCGTPTPR